MGNIDAVDKWQDGDMDRISWGQQDQDWLTLGLRGWDTDERAGFHQREKRKDSFAKGTAWSTWEWYIQELVRKSRG